MLSKSDIWHRRRQPPLRGSHNLIYSHGETLPLCRGRKVATASVLDKEVCLSKMSSLLLPLPETTKSQTAINRHLKFPSGTPDLMQECVAGCGYISLISMLVGFWVAAEWDTILTHLSWSKKHSENATVTEEPQPKMEGELQEISHASNILFMWATLM